MKLKESKDHISKVALTIGTPVAQRAKNILEVLNEARKSNLSRQELNILRVIAIAEMVDMAFRKK